MKETSDLLFAIRSESKYNKKSIDLLETKTDYLLAAKYILILLAYFINHKITATWPASDENVSLKPEFR